MARKKRALLGLAVLCLLLAAVAVASSDSVPTGSGGTRRASEQLLDVFVSLFLLLMVGGVLLRLCLVLLIRKDVLKERVAARRRRSPMASAVGSAIGIGLFALLIWWLSVDESLRQRLTDRFRRQLGAPNGATSSDAPSSYRPEFATGPVIIVLAILAVATAGWYLSDRARRRRLPSSVGNLLPILADVLDETLDDLRAEVDPRRAVIAAYARMERALAAYGLPRGVAEAPEEYLRRILADLAVSSRATAGLTALYARAKFSSHAVGPEMKEEAIAALEALQHELRAKEILAEHESAVALAELEA